MPIIASTKVPALISKSAAEYVAAPPRSPNSGVIHAIVGQHVHLEDMVVLYKTIVRTIGDGLMTIMSISGCSQSCRMLKYALTRDGRVQLGRSMQVVVKSRTWASP